MIIYTLCNKHRFIVWNLIFCIIKRITMSQNKTNYFYHCARVCAQCFAMHILFWKPLNIYKSICKLKKMFIIVKLYTEVKIKIQIRYIRYIVIIFTSIFILWTFHIAATLPYVVYLFQVMRYSQTCGSFHDFLTTNKEATESRVHGGSV
jgi:hypothetical protein